MKKRFLIALLVIIALSALLATLISGVAIERQVERLILERATDRLSLIVWSFGATTSDVDIYSHIDFTNEVLEIRKGKIVIFQYGTARIDFESAQTRVLSRSEGSYDFSLYVDIRTSMEKYMALIRIAIFVLILVFSLLFGIFGFLLLHTTVDPIVQLANSIALITSRNLNSRLPVPNRRDEFSKLVENLNTLMDEIQHSWERQSQFVGDMTHDIVTPVQILEGYRQLIERHGKTDALVDEFLDVSKIELGRLKNMTGSLKKLLASEKRRKIEHADASATITKIIHFYTGLYPDIWFEGRIPARISLPVREDDLERMIHILLENAVKYGTDDEGKGHITVELGKKRLSVQDRGHGIRPDEQEGIFERYFRGIELADQTEGAGIGLAILKKFAEEYGFRIGLESELGKGAKFVLLFAPSL